MARRIDQTELELLLFRIRWASMEFCALQDRKVRIRKTAYIGKIGILLE
jgi:hypothetical protein